MRDADAISWVRRRWSPRLGAEAAFDTLGWRLADWPQEAFDLLVSNILSERGSAEGVVATLGDHPRVLSWFDDLTEPIRPADGGDTLPVSPSSPPPPSQPAPRDPLEGSLIPRSTWIDRLLGRIGPPRYRIIRRLGAGGFGRVYEAQSMLEPTVHVALKLIHPSLSARRRAPHEWGHAMMMNAQAHPSLLVVLDNDRTRNGREGIVEFLTMALVRDGSDLSASKDLCSDLDACSALLKALSHLHTQLRMVHLDLKPSNVLRDSQNSIKVVDFGLAQQIGTQLRFAAGTLGWSAPEQLLAAAEGTGPIEADPRLDVYAAGMIVRRMLSPVWPTHAELRARPWRTQRIGLCHMVSTATQTLRPELRYRDAAAMAADLEWVCRGAPPPSSLHASESTSSLGWVRKLRGRRLPEQVRPEVMRLSSRLASLFAEVAPWPRFVRECCVPAIVAAFNALHDADTPLNGLPIPDALQLDNEQRSLEERIGYCKLGWETLFERVCLPLDLRLLAIGVHVMPLAFLDDDAIETRGRMRKLLIAVSSSDPSPT